MSKMNHTNNIISILTKIRGLLTPQTWIKGKWATDELGNGINPKSISAQCWCLKGAIEKFTTDYVEISDTGAELDKTVVELGRESGKYIPGVCAIVFNDWEQTKLTDVYMVIDLTIERLQKAA